MCLALSHVFEILQSWQYLWALRNSGRDQIWIVLRDPIMKYLNLRREVNPGEAIVRVGELFGIALCDWAASNEGLE